MSTSQWFKLFEFKYLSCLKVPEGVSQLEATELSLNQNQVVMFIKEVTFYTLPNYRFWLLFTVCNNYDEKFKRKWKLQKTRFFILFSRLAFFYKCFILLYSDQYRYSNWFFLNSHCNLLHNKPYYAINMTGV